MKNHVNLLTVVIVGAVLAFGAMVGGFIYLALSKADESQTISQEIRAGLVKSCEKVGDPIRRTVLEQLLEQKRQTKNLGRAQLITAYQQIFPAKTPTEIGRLIHKTNYQRRQHLRALRGVPPCSARY